jgi:hypothetical protein
MVLYALLKRAQQPEAPCVDTDVPRPASHTVITLDVRATRTSLPHAVRAP